MSDTYDILAVLLAADDHPHLKEEESYLEAKQKFDASTELQDAYESARAFFEKHPALVEVGPMPADVRKRIAISLEKHSSVVSSHLQMELSPWTIRTQFAWAAMLVLLLAGMAVLSSFLANQQNLHQQMLAYQDQPPADAFRSFAGTVVSRTPSLQEMGTDTHALVSWMETDSEATLSVPSILMEQEGIGCATLNGPHGQVSLLCVRADNQIVHFFVTDRKSLNLDYPSDPQFMSIQQRQALQWNDEEKAYLLMTHKPGEKIPEIFL